MRNAAGPRVDGRRPQGWRSSVFDGVVALVAATIELGRLLGEESGVGTLSIMLAVISGAALVVRRYAPVSVLALTLASTTTMLALGDYPSGASPLVAIYTLALMREARTSLAGLVPAAGVTFAGSLVVPDPGNSGRFEFALANLVLVAGVWGLGAYVQTRRRYLRELKAHTHQLEREREQLATIAVMEERTSIARDLHDIVAHSVTVMLLGVRGARDVLYTSPDIADDTLKRVETSGQQSVAELRRILTVLREPEATAKSRPQPSLADLEALIDDHRAGGLPVRMTVSGNRRPLPDGVELSIYRIVQEALTNAVKHAQPSSISVSLSYRMAGIEVEVVNDGIVRAPARPGHGLIGMRERVAMLDGSLEAGPRTDGAFRVAASLPLGGDA